MHKKIKIMKLNGPIYNKIKDNYKKGVKDIAILIDPEKVKFEDLPKLCKLINKSKAEYIFVGGSLISYDIDMCIDIIKSNTKKPVILFPGNYSHISDKADAILFLNLISGRNPEFLIGNQVNAAPILYDMDIEIISTGYILIDGGKTSSVQYMSNTNPIPADKPDIALATAIAGEMIGNKLIYLEAGSGAINPVSDEIISLVNSHCNIPLIVGGGLKSKQSVDHAFNSGAGLTVIGTAIETEPELLLSL